MEPALKDFLDSQYHRFHNREFIDSDPIQIPHLFTKKEDIEISSFLTCTIAWGQRKSIIANADRLMKLMDNCPYDFVVNSSQNEWQSLSGFVHRTFQPADLLYFLDAIRRIYRDENGMEEIFTKGFHEGGAFQALVNFRSVFFQWEPQRRTLKHISDVTKGSAAKRLNLYLMWMCRTDELGIHFGLWNKIPVSELIIPLDVHVGRVARRLGLINRKSNDWKSAKELTQRLKELDPIDPVRYDFSLFCTGLEYRQSHVK